MDNPKLGCRVQGLASPLEHSCVDYVRYCPAVKPDIAAGGPVLDLVFVIVHRCSPFAVKMVPPAGLEPASLSCHMGGTVGLGIRPTESHRLRSTNSGSAAGRGKVPAGAWQAYLQSYCPLIATSRGDAFHRSRYVRFLRRIIAFTSARSFGIGFREPKDPFQPRSTWTAYRDSIC